MLLPHPIPVIISYRFKECPTGTDLRGKELGGRVLVGVVRGDVDESVNIVLGDSLGDALGTVDVHVVV